MLSYFKLFVIRLLTAFNSCQASPCVRFNKDGNLLAVSTNENGIKVLANDNGIRSLHSIENCANDASRIASGTLVKVVVL